MDLTMIFQIFLTLHFFGCIVIGNKQPSCHQGVCLSWYQSNNNQQLILICKVTNMHLNVVFNKTSNDEYGYCVLPFPTSKCFSKYNNSFIHQDTSKNQTILTVNSSEKKLLNGVWICSYGSVVVNVSVKMETAYDVGLHIKNSGTILKGTIDEEFLTLICKVDMLESYIKIINPHGIVVGSCLAPIHTRAYGVCSNKMTQFLDSNRTILTLNISTEKYTGGMWICTHGSNKSKDTFFVEQQNEENTYIRACIKTGQNEEKYKILFIIFCIIAIVFLIATSIFYLKTRHKSRKRDEDKEELAFESNFDC